MTKILTSRDPAGDGQVSPQKGAARETTVWGPSSFRGTSCPEPHFLHQHGYAAFVISVETQKGRAERAAQTSPIWKPWCLLDEAAVDKHACRATARFLRPHPGRQRPLSTQSPHCTPVSSLSPGGCRSYNRTHSFPRQLRSSPEHLTRVLVYPQQATKRTPNISYLLETQTESAPCIVSGKPVPHNSVSGF